MVKSETEHRPFQAHPLFEGGSVRRGRLLAFCDGEALVRLSDTSRLLAFCDAEALVYLSPVDYVPPRGEVIGAAVLVLEVVGVLPNVVAEDGVETLAQRRVLIRGGDDLELAALAHEPSPAGAELLGCGLIESLLEGVKVAEIFCDLGGDSAGGRAADSGRAGRTHEVPECGVVGVAAAVVADNSANVFGNRVQVLRSEEHT